MVSFGHCVVCSSSVYGFWLPLWYLLAIVLSALLQFTVSDYSFGIFWPLCCLPSSVYSFWLPHWYLLAIVLSVLLQFTVSDYPFGIFLPLCCLPFFSLQFLITPLVSFDHCVVCPSSVYSFWLLLWYLQTFLPIMSCYICSHAVRATSIGSQWC